MDRAKCRVQFITHTTAHYGYLDSAQIALQGGCRWVQLRMKGATDEEVEPVAREVQRMCREAGAVFIIDDRVELVKKLGADGVHLGKNDMPLKEARSILGNGFIIGGTANTFDDVKSHHEAGADYIGCGPFRYTTTKSNLSPILGAEGYRLIINRMRETGISLPLVAIGGITQADIPTLMETGISGIALSGSILRADQPVEEMRKVVQQLDSPIQ
ncbi:MAG: thiamine phosphate synthase [Bacteroides sp.]|nr:thiamine phosphate synthase [Bacteroides sp.]